MTSDLFDLPSTLLEVGAVRFSPEAPFTWASGLKSPVYCDNRQLLGFPAVRAAVAAALCDSVKKNNKSATLIAGTSTAGIPWASMVADRLGLPLAYVRPEPKKHGMGRQVEGPLADKHSVVLIEDLISTGGSSLKCVEALRDEGADVLEVLALFSYGLTRAEAAFAGKNVPCQALATFSDLVKRAVETGSITLVGRESLAVWREDPQAWSDGFAQ
ncbi:MAG: orotate phosphoribosyltransferase [Holophagales bacterium]|jgi:orotate phosphoribosyltransferase|nr:orotate phosphoribosyltransferase [Holophagales bacterium]